jgi:hypothetical protein
VAHRSARFRVLAAPFARGLPVPPCIRSEGAGKAGRRPHPQPRVRIKKAHELVTTVTTGSTRLSPREGFHGFLRALPGERASLSPSSARMISANLTPASRHQDHTTSPYAAASSSGATESHLAPPTSIASRALRVVTIAIRPSSGHETAQALELICPAAKAEIFYEEGWTRGCMKRTTDLPDGQVPGPMVRSRLTLRPLKMANILDASDMPLLPIARYQFSVYPADPRHTLDPLRSDVERNYSLSLPVKLECQSFLGAPATSSPLFSIAIINMPPRGPSYDCKQSE